MSPTRVESSASSDEREPPPPEPPASPTSDNDGIPALAGKCVVLSGLTTGLNGKVATVGEYSKAHDHFQVLALEKSSAGRIEVIATSLTPDNMTEATAEQEAADRESTREALDAHAAHLEVLRRHNAGEESHSEADAVAFARACDTLGDLAEKISAALDHVSQEASPLLATKQCAIGFALSALSDEPRTPAAWRLLRALRFLVRGDALAILCAIGPRDASPAHELIVATLRQGLEAHHQRPSPPPAEQWAVRQLMRWGCECVKALAWADEGGRACHRMGAASLVARAMEAGSAWPDVQSAGVVALRNLVSHDAARRAIVAEAGAAPSSTPTPIPLVVRAMKMHASDSEIASYAAAAAHTPPSPLECALSCTALSAPCGPRMHAGTAPSCSGCSRSTASAHAAAARAAARATCSCSST